LIPHTKTDVTNFSTKSSWPGSLALMRSLTPFQPRQALRAQVSFNGAGGTQKLNLLYDSTVLNDPYVTLLGESATQWRILSFGNNGAMATSNAGISVTT
jgi:hypothetical protein